MKTKLEIIEETVNYYSEDTSRRAFNGSGCEYLMEDGRNCAVGRCFTEDGLSNFGNCRTCFDYDMIPYLKEEYRIDDYDFWCDLQELHDTNAFWNDNGLTKGGEAKVKGLKLLYKE